MPRRGEGTGEGGASPRLTGGVPGAGYGATPGGRDRGGRSISPADGKVSSLCLFHKLVLIVLSSMIRW